MVNRSVENSNSEGPLNDFARARALSSSVFNRPEYLASPAKGASGLNTSREESCQTNFPGIAGVNSISGMSVHLLIESCDTTPRENVSVMTVSCGSTPSGSGEVTRSTSDSLAQETKTRTRASKKRRERMVFWSWGL